MKIKHKISLGIRPYGKEKSIQQIRVRVTFDCQRIDFATGCRLIDKSAWDHESQMVIPGYYGPNGETDISINRTLRHQREQMEWVFSFYEVNEIYPTLAQVSEKYLERLSGSTPKKSALEKKMESKSKDKELDFFSVYDMFLKECGEKNAWTKATFEKMEALRVDLQAFRESISFPDLTESTLTSLVAYWRDSKILRRPRKKKGNRESYDTDDLIGLKNSTIEKKLGYFRWFLNWASDHGYNQNQEYKTFRPTLK